MFVWGLNDKDQLGGLKGSKIKLPVPSDALSRLQPAQIAGGSKCTFIVSQDGRVSTEGVGVVCVGGSKCTFIVSQDGRVSTDGVVGRGRCLCGLSRLQPAQIAGGSKCTFIVSQDDRVSTEGVCGGEGEVSEWHPGYGERGVGKGWVLLSVGGPVSLHEC